MNEQQLIEDFEHGVLSVGSFHHADHVHLAFAYLQRQPVLSALEKFSAALRRFAAANHRPNLYNETITWAYLLLIHERMAKLDGSTEALRWETFALANPDLFIWKPGILSRYYSEALLQSELAKKTFLFPDKVTCHISVLELAEHRG
jgi:hypothetical protein